MADIFITSDKEINITAQRYVFVQNRGQVFRYPDMVMVQPYDVPPNPDALQYKEWLNLGFNPVITIAPEVFDPIQYQKYIASIVQLVLDNKAQEMGYDNILSAVSYADSTVSRFAVEGDMLKAWRDSVWEYCYQVLEQCVLGYRVPPTAEKLLSELPVLTT